jgi:uncharacterized phage protein gp47/JayE
MSPSHNEGQFTAVRAVEADAYTATTSNGVGIDLQGRRGALFILNAGTMGTNATIDAYLQDSSDNSTWANVAGATFTQLLEASAGTDSAGEAVVYSSGAERYVRAVLVVAVATSDAAIVAATF